MAWSSSHFLHVRSQDAAKVFELIWSRCLFVRLWRFRFSRELTVSSVSISRGQRCRYGEVKRGSRVANEIVFQLLSLLKVGWQKWLFIAPFQDNLGANDNSTWDIFGKQNSCHFEVKDFRNLEHVVLDLFSNFKMCKIRGFLVEPQEHVRTPRG